MRRVAKWFGWLLGILVGVPLLLVAFVLIAANTDPGRHLIERLTPWLTGGTVRLAGISGRFPDAIRVAEAQLRDPQGTYATIDDFVLDWSPLRLLHDQIDIDRLAARTIDVMRMPVASSSSGGFALPAPVILRDLTISRVNVAAAIAHTEVAVALHGSGRISAPDVFQATLDVQRLGGAGSYQLTATSDPAGIHATLKASEPDHGLMAELAGLPDLGGLSLGARLDGPRSAVTTHVTLAAGPLQAAANGTLDLVHLASDLTVSASAPAMRPRPDVSWQAVTLNAHVSGAFAKPDASGQFHIDALTVAGAEANIAADVTGNTGRVRLDGRVSGLRLPMPNGDLLAGEPLTITADARLNEPNLPVHLVLRHPLVTADAQAQLGASKVVDATVRLPNLAPFAALSKVDIQGGLSLALHAATQGNATAISANGTVGITGGLAQARSLVGDAGQFELAASLHGNDLTLSRLRFTGQQASLSASGSVVANRVNLAWSLSVADLAAAEPSLAGQLTATGKAQGTTNNLDLTADINGAVATRSVSSGPLSAHIDVRGLPNNPSGRITAQGDLLNAPVQLAVDLRRLPDGFGIDIVQANWKSLKAAGQLELPTTTMVPSGHLRIDMARMADVAPLIGQSLAGSLTTSLDATADNVHLSADLRNADWAGNTAARIALDANVTQPQSRPSLDAKLDAEGVRASGVAGSLHATASGPESAIGVKLSALLPDLRGSPARLNATGMVDALGRSVSVASLQGEWHQQSIRLLRPVRIGYAEGISIDQLRLGVRQAVVEVAGKVGPTLDLTASVRNLPADIAAVVSPAFAVDGTVQAEARISGSPHRPVGKIQLSAAGIRMRSGPGRALPPATFTADVQLNGSDAGVDAHLRAGRSRLSVTGRAPLSLAEDMNLHTDGTVDLALLDPILTAGGRRVAGQIALNATLAGSPDAPRIAGTARLTGGEVQDYTSGVHLTDITVRLQADGPTVRIEQFAARAGPGTIGVSGTVGVMQPGIPVDLALTAHDARPLASDLISATVDANLTLRGDAVGQLAVGGNVRVQRADIRVPERLPASIAVLPVRLPGAKPAPAPTTTSTIALNLSLDAPRQVYIRGRGLDVEFGGSMHVGGTLDAPRTTGALDLRRGSLSLAGRSLTFTEGQISFNGGSITDPALHLVATSASADVVATLTIGGTASDPKITLSSVPALPQDEVLAHLLFGSGVGRLGALDIAEIASGLATLTGVGGGIGDPLDQVRQGLGLDRLSVTSDASGSATLEAGRYVSPRVYLGAKQTASGASQAIVQVDIAKGLKLEGAAGTGGGTATGATAVPGSDNGSSIGLTYQFQY